MVLYTVTWALLGLLLGASAFFVAGLTAALVLGDAARDRIGRWYVDMAMSAYDDAVLYAEQTGGLSITTVTSAPKLDGDQATIDGVTGHWRDPLAVKSTLAGNGFGIGLESTSAYISPLVAEFGKHGSDAYQRGELGASVEDGEEQVTLDFALPAQPQVLDLREAAKALPGSCKRRWGALAFKWGELSQEKFHDRVSLGQTVMLLAAFAVGVGLAIGVIQLRPEGGDVGREIAVMVEVMGT